MAVHAVSARAAVDVFPRFQDRLAGSWPSVPAQAARRARARAEAVMIRAHMVVSSTLGAVEARTPLVADRTPAPRRFNTPLEARGPVFAVIADAFWAMCSTTPTTPYVSGRTFSARS